MKKYMSTALCIVLLISMVAILGGCGDDDDSFTPEDLLGMPTEPEEVTILGTWAMNLDMGPIMNIMIKSQFPQISDDFQATSWDLYAEFTFRADGTYYSAADLDQLLNGMGSMLKDMAPGLRSAAEDMIAQQGLNMTVDEYYQLQTGMNFNEYYQWYTEYTIDAYRTAMTTNSLDGLMEKGSYTFQGDKLYMISDDSEDSQDGYYVYRLSAKKLEFLAYVAPTQTEDATAMQEEMREAVFPMQFTKIDEPRIPIPVQPTEDLLAGTWMDGTSQVIFTETGDYKSGANYGTYTINSDNSLEILYGEYSYTNGCPIYKWGPEAKEDSDYWYISGSTLYFRGYEYTKK